MKKAFLLILSFSICLPWAWAEHQLLDQVVAVVNDEAITQSEVDSLFRPIYEQYQREYQGSELFRKLTDARRKLLNQLIEDRLVYQQAKKLGIQADEVDIDRRITKFKEKFTDPKEMENAMRREGMTLTYIRERIRRQAMIENLQDSEIRSKIVISPIEIERYFQEHPEEFSQAESLKVRSITLKKNDDARAKGLKDEESWKKIQDLRKKISAGENFEKLATQFSQDSNAREGGLGEWIGRGDMIPEIDEAIFKLKSGEISEVIETSMGYHLFLVEEKKEGHKRNFEEARDAIYAALYRKKSEERFGEWMTELKRTAYITVR